MKKLGQKFSFLTKILLVFGLLISNLSSLSVVFAYEVSEDVVVTLSEELLEINYTEKLAEEVEAVDVKVYENFTYSGGLSENEVVNVYSLTAEELLAASEGTLKISYNSIFVNEGNVVNNYELFDGTYSVKVEMVDVTDYSENVLDETVVVEENAETTEEEIVTTDETVENQTLETEEVSEVVLAVGTYEKVIEHKKGLNVKLYDSVGNEITLVDGKYPVSLDDTKVTVVAQVLSGGLNPTDVFEYDGVEYVAKDLLEREFRADKDFAGYLFGEYELPVEVTLLKPLEKNETTEEVVLTEEVVEDEYEEVVYTDNVSIMYGTYELNAQLLNEVLVSEGLGELYLFAGDSKDGNLYSLTEFSKEDSELHVKSMLDLYNVVTTAIDGDDTLTYQLLKDGVDVLSGYDEATATQSLDEYLSSIELNDSVVLSISGNGLTITYKVVGVADLNNDSTLTEEDLLELVDQVIGESEVADLEKSDVIIDEELNILDVLYLKEIIKSQSWDALINVEEATLNGSLNVVTGDKEELVSGDEFAVEYVLSLEQLEEVSGFSGLFEYNKESLELISVEALTDWLGNYSKDSGKFLYFGEESLVGPEEVSTENEDSTGENIEETTLTDETIVTEDYVLLTAKFRALKAGTHTVTVKENEYFNDNTYLQLSEDLVLSTEVVVVESEDNTLSYLEVAGKEIVLEDNKYEYEITVNNDVTLVDLKYIVTNVAANVTSTVYPEELVEGNNTVVITVTSESGVSQDYTITVIREEAPEEETITQVSNNYYGDYEDDNEEEVVVTPGDEDDDNDDDDKNSENESNLSRIVIIILILLVIAGLVYLIFKDDEDEETKKANKDVNKLKKESIDATAKSNIVKETSKTSSKPVNKIDGKKTSSSSKNKKPNNKKKER